MKKIFWLFLLSITLIHADTNNTMTIGEFGSIFEGTSSHITILITFYSLLISGLLALFSVVAYKKSSDIMEKIEKNKEYIDTIYEKLKKDIEAEIDKQIIYNAKDVMSKVEDDAYRKIDRNVEQIGIDAQEKLFDYQQLVFKVNQAKKYAYEEVLGDKDLTPDKKLVKSVAIQGRYNETNNHDVPNLFSTDIENRVIPTAKKLSEFEELKDIVIEYLERLLAKDIYSYANKSRIKDLLREYYDWKDI